MLGGSLEFAVPITLGALAGILSERSGMLNIALEGKMLVGACVASVAASVVRHRSPGTTFIAVVIGIASAMLVAGSVGHAPGLAGHPPEGGPDHRGRR